MSLLCNSQETDIPIPNIFGYEMDEGNAVGCPLILMEYIHGNTAQEVAQSYPGDHEGIQAQLEDSFWRQLAHPARLNPTPSDRVSDPR